VIVVVLNYDTMHVFVWLINYMRVFQGRKYPAVQTKLHNVYLV